MEVHPRWSTEYCTKLAAHAYAWRTLANFCFKSGDLPPLAQKLSMYAGLAKTFVFCCPDQLNKRLADSKIESARRLLPMYARSKTFVVNVRANSTYVVATSQSQRVAFTSLGLAAVTCAVNNNGGLAE